MIIPAFFTGVVAKFTKYRLVNSVIAPGDRAAVLTAGTGDRAAVLTAGTGDRAAVLTAGA